MVSVTSHAKRRLKERCGVSKNSAMNMAERAFNKGISFENASTDLKKYISSVYIRHEKTVIIFVFMAIWFTFLITAH